MRELIQELVQTEAEARRMVEAARIQAERLVADAQKQVQALSARVRAESRVEAEKLIDAAVRQAQAEKSQRVLKAEAEIKQSVRLDVAIQEEIAEAVVRCICGDASRGPGRSSRTRRHVRRPCREENPVWGMIMPPLTDNQEFVAALLHGRRSRMGEGPRLQALCRTRTLADFGREVTADPGLASASEIEFRLAQDLVQEVAHLSREWTGPAAKLMQWLVGRFQVENLKLFVRRLMTGAPLALLKGHLLAMPIELQLDDAALAKAESMDALIRLVPRGPLRQSLVEAVGWRPEQPRSFFLRPPSIGDTIANC